ncbi:hypothetical protein Rhe02_55430 [Rhizocola hellebori]|uniref:Uncharacterized protein n=1 Tax=Rhizocola hellebori TaxID=1392758 RepID=A0A8J3QDS1_9ACTN|nr:hypothetical protein [Rhizocola hellebori]GIH07476.1 hypothetical protein Rhe02_55430 [Rhizocola hellebori]
MPWIRKATAPPPPHTCPNWAMTSDTSVDDLYRCDECRKLWRIGWACDICDYFGDHAGFGGGHKVGYRWRRARMSQRIRFWRHR